MNIRLYTLCRIYLALSSMYYLWYLALYFFTPNFPAEINHIAFFGVYWFLITILYFYFNYKYLIPIGWFLVTGGWSFINILSIDWIMQGFHFYFYYCSLLIIPYTIYEVYTITEKMKKNVTGTDENGDEFEMDFEDYELLKEEDVIEEEEKTQNSPITTNRNDFLSK